METLSQSYEVTAAIDFGTSCSGYAYKYKDKSKIHVNGNWKSGSQSFKVPTAILFDGQKQFKSFGYKAEDDYNKLVDEGQGNEYMFFNHFKMVLYDEKSLSRLELKATNGKSMNALKVFSSAISYLKDHLLDTVNTTTVTQSLTAANVRWVLTVPAIWSETSKSFMVEAAKLAGIDKEDVLIALEPECAALYCKKEYEKDFPLNKKNVDVTYMVIDIGGGTVDAVLHELSEDGTIREIGKATGNNAGGTCVDRKFEEYLEKILSKPVIEHAKTKLQWIDVEREFEHIKRSVNSSEASETVTIDLDSCLDRSYYSLNRLSIFEAFKQGIISIKNIKMQDKDEMIIFKKDIRDMIKDTTVQILEPIEELFNESKNIKLDYVILAGGFSNSSIVLNEIHNFFGEVSVIRPEEAELAVLKGAVLYGLKPNQIVSRISRRTYGVTDVRYITPNDPNHLIITRGQGENMRMFCQHFKTLVTIGESVKIGKKIKLSYGIMPSQPFGEFCVKIWSSSKKEVKYCNEEGVDILGKVQIPKVLDLEDRTFNTDIIFGKTSIQINVTDDFDGRTFQADFDFL